MVARGGDSYLLGCCAPGVTGRFRTGRHAITLACVMVRQQRRRLGTGSQAATSPSVHPLQRFLYFTSLHAFVFCLWPQLNRGVAVFFQWPLMRSSRLEEDWIVAPSFLRPVRREGLVTLRSSGLSELFPKDDSLSEFSKQCQRLCGVAAAIMSLRLPVRLGLAVQRPFNVPFSSSNLWNGNFGQKLL